MKTAEAMKKALMRIGAKDAVRGVPPRFKSNAYLAGYGLQYALDQTRDYFTNRFE